MKKYLYIIFAWALTMSLTSCEDDDQYSIESVIIGRAWTGDVRHECRKRGADF